MDINLKEVQMKYNNFIFDLDGVLVDACEWHKQALNRALFETCNYKISNEEHLKTYNGIPTKKKLEILNEKKIVKKQDFDKIFELKQKYTVDCIKRLSKKREEKLEFLEFCKKNNIRLFCYTNSIKMTAHLMLETAGIKDCFEVILTNEDVKNPKPDEEGYLFLLNKYNLDPYKTLIFEDSPKGLAAAWKTECDVYRVRDVDDLNLSLVKRLLK